MDSGLWPQSSAFSPAGVVPIPYSATGILSRAAMQWYCWKNAFTSTHLQSRSISPPLSLLKYGFCQLGPRPSDKYRMTRSVPEEKNKTKQKEGSIHIASPSLSPGGTRNERCQISSQEQKRRVKNIWMTESMTNAAEPSPVHSTISEEWLHCETQDSALTFPEIPWRGLLRFIQMGQRHQPEEICDSGWINAKWAKYLKNQSPSCPLLSRPFLRRPCWAHV